MVGQGWGRAWAACLEDALHQACTSRHLSAVRNHSIDIMERNYTDSAPPSGRVLMSPSLPPASASSSTMRSSSLVVSR